MPEDLLAIDDVVKRYDALTALKGVSLRVRAGTVHGLLGENGAGKSTLVKTIAGLVAPTSGTIVWNGQPVANANVEAMEDLGVFLVTQEPMVVDSMTVADNLMLGRWPSAGIFVNDRKMYEMAASFLDDLDDANLDPHQLAGELSAVDRRKLNISRALHSGGKLIILDEPTTDLSVSDKALLFDFIRKLKTSGVSFIFISHYNEEILEICDEVSVLRDGEMVRANQSVAAVNSDQLSEMVVGRDVTLFQRGPQPEERSVAWSLRDITAPGLSVTELDIHEGEIIGFAGLPGSGARELGQVLFGLKPGSRGHLNHRGTPFDVPAHPAEAIENRIAFLAEDRLRNGFIGIQSIAENITLSSIKRVATAGWIRRSKERDLVSRFSKVFEIKAPSQDVPVLSLSGGNQQKVCISRLMATEPQLVILNEPTRGIDVGVKEEVHRIVDDMTKSGVSAIVITSDLDEMLRVADRIAMFSGGRIISVQPTSDLTKDIVFSRAFASSETARLSA
ncbi:MAG: sugar ABC transporter ATP-binding protein [Pseudomonadota bacterium]